jgi:hypothetical protein
MDKSWVNLIWVGLYDYYVNPQKPLCNEVRGVQAIVPIFLPIWKFRLTLLGRSEAPHQAQWHVPGMLHEMQYLTSMFQLQIQK